MKDLLPKDEESVHQLVNNEHTKLSTPFSADDLIRYWDAYLETLEGKAHLQNTMINCKPVLLDDFNFEVKVYNPAQREELVSNSLELLKTLRLKLKNDHVQMHIRIDETNEKKRVYTAAEKYELLNELNPLLSRLKSEFDLDID